MQKTIKTLATIPEINHFFGMNNTIVQNTDTNNLSSAVVAVIRCPSYDPVQVEQAVLRGIGLVGGVNAFANKNEHLLFKPNVLSGTDPAKCVVTHPSVLRAVVAAFSATGAILQYGDSPAGLSQTETAMKKCGYDKALAGHAITIVPFEKSTQVSYSAGLTGRRLTISRPVLDADGIINIPKLKTHALTRMTGAVKNLFGCVPMLVKGEYHARFPDVYIFSQLLADIATFIRPRLHIMDAIDAMEGNGPQNGTPKKLGALLISTDPVALDVVACKLIGLDPTYVPTIIAATKTGLGCGDPDAIRLIGDDLNPLINTSFDVVRMPPAVLPHTTILGAIKRLFLPRPVIRAKKCTRCGKCVAICPLKPPALSQKVKTHPPTYQYGRCIRCYCCQEICPSDAIMIKNPLLRKLLPFATYLSLFITRIRTRRR